MYHMCASCSLFCYSLGVSLPPRRSAALMPQPNSDISHTDINQIHKHVIQSTHILINADLCDETMQSALSVCKTCTQTNNSKCLRMRLYVSIITHINTQSGRIKFEMYAMQCALLLIHYYTRKWAPYRVKWPLSSCAPKYVLCCHSTSSSIVVLIVYWHTETHTYTNTHTQIHKQIDVRSYIS